jgi:Na+-driven multidrug efflux pump
MKKDSPFNSGWFYLVLVVLLVLIGLFLKVKGSEWQVMAAGMVLQTTIILTLLYIIFKRKKRKKRGMK